MSSLFLLRLPLSPPPFVSIRSIIYFRFFDLCRLYLRLFEFMLVIKRKERLRDEEKDGKETVFPTFLLDSPLFIIKTHNTVRQALLAIIA